MILGEDPKHVSQLDTILSLSLSLCLSPILSLSLSPDLSLCISLKRSWSWFSHSFIVCFSLSLSLSIWGHLGASWSIWETWLGVQRLHLGVIWRRTSEIAHFHRKNLDFHQNVKKHSFFTLFTQK